MACICHLELPCVCLCGMSSVVCLPSSGLAPGFCRIARRHIRFTYKSYGFNLSLMDTGYGLR